MEKRLERIGLIGIDAGISVGGYFSGLGEECGG